MRKSFVILALSLMLVASLYLVGMAGQTQPGKQSKFIMTEILRVMDKGTDYIVIAEEPMYVVPKITKITSRYGTPISLSRLPIPCLAEITYSRWVKGVDKRPVVVELRVKKVYRDATSSVSRE